VERTKGMQEKITREFARALASEPASHWNPPSLAARTKQLSARRSTGSKGTLHGGGGLLPGQRTFAATTVESVLEEDEELDEACALVAGGGSAVVLAYGSPARSASASPGSPRLGGRSPQGGSPRSPNTEHPVCKSEADPLAVSAAVKKAMAQQQVLSPSPGVSPRRGLVYEAAVDSC